jgi:CheY-like chemotaxis protein
MGVFDFFNPPAPPPIAVPQPKKILVVEDEQYLRDFYQELLTGEGYTILTATNGVEALDVVSKNPPDLILLDLTMPVMNGNEVLRKLWDNNLTKVIPVIVLTNAGSVTNMEKSEMYSVFRFFIKSNVSPEEIIETVSQALKREKLHV